MKTLKLAAVPALAPAAGLSLTACGSGSPAASSQSAGSPAASLAPGTAPVHTIFHLGSIGTGSRKTLSGPRYHAHLKSQSGQVYRCEHNHRTESAAINCANSKATQQAALAEFARLDQEAAAQAAATQARADRKARALLEPFINMSGKEKTMKTRSRMIAGGTWCPDKTLGVLILATFAAIIALLILGAVS